MPHRMVAPIVSIKHFVARALTSTGAGAMSNLSLVVSVAQTAVVNTRDVVEGSIVKAVWIELWIISTDGTGLISQFVITLEKLPAQATAMTAAQALNLMAYPNKKNILYTTQGMIGSEVDGQPVPIIRQWFKIPKGKQRMGLGDRINLNFTTVGQAVSSCGMFIFKEYK